MALIFGFGEGFGNKRFGPGLFGGLWDWPLGLQHFLVSTNGLGYIFIIRVCLQYLLESWQ